MALTVAQRIEQRGWKKGKEIGWKESKEETATNLLKLGVDIKTVILATGLTEKEIKELISGSQQEAFQTH